MRLKRFISAPLAILIVIMSTVNAYALTSKGACAIDAATGQTLYEYNADEALAPASMTKVMTTYIIYDKMREGAFNKYSKVVCTENAAKLSRDSIATNVPLTQGEAYTVGELIGAIMVPSACAACTLMGEYIAGSEAAFATLMNQYVYRLGLEAYYDDASGLSDNNRITARSMATLGARLVNEFPDVLTYTSQHIYYFRGKAYENTNELLTGGSYPYEGADGLKTGTTTLAGRCLTATAVRNGKRIVGVTMRSTSTKSRYTDIHDILNAGFAALDANTDFVTATNIRMYISGAEIPTFYHSGKVVNEAVILAENLENYGFNISYDAASRTVYVTRDKQKEITPIARENFPQCSADGKLADVVQGSDLKVVINDDGYLYSLKRVYDLSGYAAISVDELKNIYRYTWNAADMSGHFEISI